MLIHQHLELCIPVVNVKHHHTSTRKQKLCCKMNQIPANSNDATTGHKLQGMSKDIIIVSSWPTGGLSVMFKNWEYVLLSRVRTLSGLYWIYVLENYTPPLIHLHSLSLPPVFIVFQWSSANPRGKSTYFCNPKSVLIWRFSLTNLGELCQVLLKCSC